MLGHTFHLASATSEQKDGSLGDSNYWVLPNLAILPSDVPLQGISIYYKKMTTLFKLKSW